MTIDDATTMGAIVGLTACMILSTGGTGLLFASLWGCSILPVAIILAVNIKQGHWT